MLCHRALLHQPIHASDWLLAYLEAITVVNEAKRAYKWPEGMVVPFDLDGSRAKAKEVSMVTFCERLDAEGWLRRTIKCS